MAYALYARLPDFVVNREPACASLDIHSGTEREELYSDQGAIRNTATHCLYARSLFTVEIYYGAVRCDTSRAPRIA